MAPGYHKKELSFVSINVNGGLEDELEIKDFVVSLNDMMLYL